MKQLIDFIPLLVFFLVYKLKDIYWATGSLIIATAVQILLTWFIWRKVEKMHVITFIMVLFFGSLTMFFHDDTFIKWKVTVVYGLFALALLLSDWVFNKPLIRSMFGGNLTLPDKQWRRLGYAWATFFAVCALLNLYIAFHFEQAVWVNFKVFGLFGLTILFAIGSGVYLWKYLPEEFKKQED